MLKLYNTLTRKTEDVKPGSGKTIRMYTCGPTVYNFAHIGNLRSYICADLVYRALKYDGHKVEWVMNVTDIEDKIITGTIAKFGDQATVENLKTFTDEYYQKFLQDLDEVNVSRADIKFIKVTDVVPQIQDFVLQLLDKGYAYQADDGSTYFSIEKYQNDFHDYGALVGEKFLQGKKVGARVKVDDYDKDNLSDFALWKAHEPKDAQIFWDHPKLGKGRPGWHIECSVINKIAFGGQPTDIHTGGVDLIFPHHTNEIAQSQPIYQPFVKHWFHSEHLLVEDKKMAKREHNFYTLRDLAEKNFSGAELRYAFLQSHYSTQQNFTWDSLTAARNALSKLYDFARGEQHPSDDFPQYERDFLSLINDNLNIPQALALTWDMISNSDFTNPNKLASLLKFDAVFGLDLSSPPKVEIPQAVLDLVAQRQQARKEKNFAQSDELREEILKLGFEVEDKESGPKIRPIT